MKGLKPGGFGIGNILGLLFILFGILLVLSTQDFNFPIDLGAFQFIFQWGAALGSILGGFAMLFKKHDSVPEVKT